MVNRWIKKDPLLAAIVMVVIVGHAVGLLWVALNDQVGLGRPQKSQKLVVKTVKLQPVQHAPVKEEQVVACAPPPPPPPTPPPSAQKKLPPKKKPKPAPRKMKDLPKKKKEPPKKPAVDTKKQKLLREAQEKLAKIEQRSDNIRANSSKESKVPQRIEKLSFVQAPSANSQLSTSEAAYRNELANHLKAQLQLPELGDVEVKLTVNKQGHVEKVLVVRSENVRNADYISITLPALTLPAFGKRFSGGESHTFHITLTNE